jgi:hypothetical protein
MVSGCLSAFQRGYPWDVERAPKWVLQMDVVWARGLAQVMGSERESPRGPEMEDTKDLQSVRKLALQLVTMSDKPSAKAMEQKSDEKTAPLMAHAKALEWGLEMVLKLGPKKELE